MAVINKLSKQMADLIAAGEVVERPSSVVKELVENSVDAGADNITVEIQHGGITYIRVTDNGCGISKEDMKTAFLSHATSKIKNEEDLNKILTLGFRGEALPSIAAVSKITMISKTSNEDIGNSYFINGGQVGEFKEAGCADGTTVIVKNLFFNTPARMKFLKRDVTEGNYVSGVVEKIALSYSNISFRFIRDGKTVFVTNGDGNLHNVCYSAFGKEFSNGLIAVDNHIGLVNVTGLITPPFKSRGSRGMQYFFVNGRSVKNSTIIAAFENAYKNSVMVGKFPGGVLFITLPPQLVDVNVHPSKIEVRFSDERSVFDAVYHAVKTALSENTEIKKAHLPQIDYMPNGILEKPREEFSQTSIESNRLYTEKVLEPISHSQNSSFVADITNNYSAKSDESFDSIKIEFPPVNNKPNIDIVVDEQEIENNETEIINNDIQKYNEVKEENQEISFKLLGEVYKTYLLIEIEGTFYIMDKHAAHERINFNKLTSQNNHLGSQILIQPVSVSLGKEEYSVVLENLDLIKKAGFDIDDFGSGSVLVRSCPIDLDNCEISPLISEIAEYLTKNRKDILNEHLDWIYHNVSCRAAIKAGDDNSYAELYELCRTVINDKNVRYCPHGRPVMIEISKYELEKQFGRV